MTDVYQVVGQNNRNLLVQSKRIAPFHEDLTKVQQFEPSTVSPGHWTKIKIDFKHSTDRELILNDIRLQFELDFAARTQGAVGKVFAMRGTDLIRELWVKINEDVVFKVERKGELTFLYMMNNHRTAGEPSETQDAYMLHKGIIPQGQAPFLTYNASTNAWTDVTSVQETKPGYEKFDGRPRLIYNDGVTPVYRFQFDMSLNQLIGPIFHRLHVRRIEYAQIELRFEPWVSTTECQDFLLFKSPPLGDPATNPWAHPYSVAKFVNVQIRQYRTTLLDGCQGFTLPDSKMLSWLMHRYSRREYAFNFSTQTYLDIQLNDWEIRTNITRVYWMLAPPDKTANENDYTPMGEPCEGYDVLSGVEIRWKNDVVLDLATTYDVHRHYTLSENKRHGFDDPFVRFVRLLDHSHRPALPSTTGTAINGGTGDSWPNTYINAEKVWYAWKNWAGTSDYENMRYEFPIYHVDLNMNIFQGAPGSEVVGGIVNDTSDYVIRIKQLTDAPVFRHTGARTLWVFLEYQTLVNLSGGSNQFSKSSQVVTKQLNLQ